MPRARARAAAVRQLGGPPAGVDQRVHHRVQLRAGRNWFPGPGPAPPRFRTRSRDLGLRFGGRLPGRHRRRLHGCRLGSGRGGDFGWLGDAEDVQQQGPLHRVGPVPASPGESLGCGQLPGLVGPGRLADLAAAGGAVLLEPPLGGPAAGLGLSQHPEPAPFDLDLGQPGAAAQRVVGQPLRQPPLGRCSGVMRRMPERRPQMQRVHEIAAHADLSPSVIRNLSGRCPGVLRPTCWVAGVPDSTSTT